MSSTEHDLPKLAMALEYADLAAAHYLAGGSDYAARLLAAAAEQVLGDLAKLLGPHHAQSDEVQTQLARIAMRYKAPTLDTRGPAHRYKSTGPARPSRPVPPPKPAMKFDKPRRPICAPPGTRSNPWAWKRWCRYGFKKRWIKARFTREMGSNKA